MVNKIYLVATALTVHGIETGLYVESMKEGSAGQRCNSTYRSRY